ncbi:MAG: winged helix DNA-binding protein [Euryarchaeota archaeon]|nr:winged helix DNA-binding protein [Euryarchaeota archaeon]
MPTSLLLTVRQYDRTYVSVLAKECNCTYPHAVKTLWGMERLGLLTSEKVGRVKYVQLTDRGKLVADALYELVTNLGASDAPYRNDFDHVNQKINNVVRKVATIQKELEMMKSVDADEATRFNRRLGPYYRELNAIQFLLNSQPNSPLNAKAAMIARTLDSVKHEIKKKEKT